jgi:hypothetical protein
VDLAITWQRRVRQGGLDEAHHQMLAALSALGVTRIEGSQNGVVSEPLHLGGLHMSRPPTQGRRAALTRFQKQVKVMKASIPHHPHVTGDGA